jgi:phosphatidylinositol kinase/protein kinase (PI-3  family)
MSPGGLNFESSPFKLTEEYVEFMDGKDSTDYQYFQELFCEGMKALR